MPDILLDETLTIDRKIELLKIAKELSVDVNAISISENYEFLIRVIRVNPSSFQKIDNYSLFRQ